MGVKTGFRRTPKFDRAWRQSSYALSTDITIWLELALMLYAFWAVRLAWDMQRELVIYLLIYGLSFATVFAWSLHEALLLRFRLGRQGRRSARKAVAIINCGPDAPIFTLYLP